MFSEKSGGVFEFFRINSVYTRSLFNQKGLTAMVSPETSSPGQFLFFRRVRTVTRHHHSVNFYFTDESEPSLVII